MAKQRQPRTSAAQPAEAPRRPALQEVTQFLLLGREVEIQYRPHMQEALQNKVNAVADSLRGQTPTGSGLLGGARGTLTCFSGQLSISRPVMRDARDMPRHSPPEILG